MAAIAATKSERFKTTPQLLEASGSGPVGHRSDASSGVRKAGGRAGPLTMRHSDELTAGEVTRAIADELCALALPGAPYRSRFVLDHVAGLMRSSRRSLASSSAARQLAVCFTSVESLTVASAPTASSW